MVDYNGFNKVDAKGEDMTLEEKYKIHFIDGRRYYECDMTNMLPDVEYSVPFYFRWKDLVIKKGSWSNFTLTLVTELDKRFPHDKQWYLSLSYSWSKTRPFSETPKVNHYQFKDIYLNINHTASHSLMSIQVILQAFGIDLKDCFLLISRHSVREPKEVKEYIKQENIKQFTKMLLVLFQQKPKNIDTIIKNVDFLSGELVKRNVAFDDFLLFDDLYYFLNYKDAIYKDLSKRMPLKIKTITKTFNFLTSFYKSKLYYGCDKENYMI